MLRDAELAMYYAKRLGGDRIEAYRASARSITACNKASEEDLDRGMRQGEVQVQFLPIMDVQANVIAGAEVTLRWNHPTRGMVPPEEFEPLAERSGLSERLSRLAFEQSAFHVRDWMGTQVLGDDFFVIIALSPTQLSAETLLNDMRALLDNDRRIAEHIKLELTEAQVMSNPEHAAYVLALLREQGLGLCLNEFGIGQSSLSYLHRMPFDTVKLAPTYVQIDDDTGMERTQVPIMRSIATLCSDLDLNLIAAGIEKVAEVDRIRAMNCRFAQGTFFGDAMPAAEFSKQLASQQQRLRQSRPQRPVLALPPVAASAR